MKVLYMRLLVGLALLSLLGLASCTKQDDVPESGTDVYMSFQMSQVASGSGVRAQGSSPSINTDVNDREDFVSRFGVFIFETGASGTKVAEKFSEYAFFVMKFKKGTYDFYFIANYPTSDETSLSQMSKSQLETYLQTLKPYALHHIPLSTGPFFPMARVYRSQTIIGNGSPMDPIPFKPVVGTTNQLVPISSLGNDWQSTSNIQDQVRLVRANAKIDLTINGEGAVDVAKVEYYNAAANYTFAELNPRPASQALLTSPLVFNYTAPTPTMGVIQTKLYVPERLFNTTETKGWDTTTDQAQGGVNYIQITMKSGRTYRVPVVSNGPATGYQTFAKDATRADYNVIRNHHYKYEIAIAKDSKELVVKAVVLPWTLVESEISFGKIVFNQTFNYSVGTELSADGKTILLHQQTPIRFTFKLTEPKGAIWRATLTNGLDFSLQPDPASPNGGVSGVADPNTEYSMVITPLKPYDGTPRLTEFYITVNGEEVSLIAGQEEVGPGKRPVFKQVE
ncbi:MAG: hypothetical protein PUK66_04500 [Bacteroidales bacterium]|uniref:hypothetical protein n=1 Tax=Porphyromonas sp. TaxID=1924944 RepID=UPI002978C32A|nr:hypothetical protein [Porphyromonas sp.]MDD7438085.1 hypothetical protein [Bacteroidales bacterium]MDY3067401.1 hypothetical protein [Porphyromonas sp.]